MTESVHKGKKRQITGFTIIRIPYFLEPNYDPNKIYIETNRERLIKKWGGIQNWNIQKQRHQLKERGQQVGISHFNLDRYASNTMKSHVLIQYISQLYGLYVSEYIYDILNQYHFVDGYALNDTKRLCTTITKALQTLYQQQPTCFYHPNQNNNNGNLELQFSEQVLYDFLLNSHSTNIQQNILQTVDAVHELGINGIPTFIINGGTHILSGAVHAQEIVHVLDTIQQIQSPIFANTLQISNSIVQFGTYTRDRKTKPSLLQDGELPSKSSTMTSIPIIS